MSAQGNSVSSLARFVLFIICNGLQNPTQQGGGRKGLPKSFLNRFTKVYLDPMDSSDLHFIASNLYPSISPLTHEKIIEFNTRVYHDTMVAAKYGRKGSPWEFNLRDILRWCDLIRAHPESSPKEFVDLIYLQRMRTAQDRQHISEAYSEIFGEPLEFNMNPGYHVTPTTVQVGKSFLPRSNNAYQAPQHRVHLLHRFLSPLENIMKCVEMGWMCILSGPTASGKTSMVRLLAQLTRNTLYEFSMNTGVDTTELLGTFVWGRV